LPDVAGKDGSASPHEATVSTPDKRFLRRHRLTARRQFLAVYAEGRRVFSKSFTLFGAPNDTGSCRLGLTVPKRIGKSHRRNRVKRILREVFRTHRAALEPVIDIVVNTRVGIDTRTHAEIEQEFLASVCRLGRGPAARRTRPTRGDR
jgi:ribonuclease P protein component